jgi:hypothetical protein
MTHTSWVRRKARKYLRVDNEEFRLVSVIKFFSKLLSKIRVFEIVSFSSYYLLHQMFFFQIFVLFVCDYDSSFFWSIYEWFRIWRHCRDLTTCEDKIRNCKNWDCSDCEAILQEFNDLRWSKWVCPDCETTRIWLKRDSKE